MDKIASTSNTLVKDTTKLQQKKYREISGKFLLEGYKPVKEAFDYGIELEYIFVEENKISEYTFLKTKIIPTTSAVLKKISTTASAPDCVGIGKQKRYKIKDFTNAQKILLLENIKDAGNLGTILRTSAAFGIDLVVLYGDCVDLYNPKVVRSSVGCLWKIPIVSVLNVEELNKYFKQHKKIATLPKSKNLLKNFKQTKPFVIMFGSEADGLSEELRAIADTDVKIEMQDSVESLNLSISCGIILYKLLNQ